eukprot:GFYU01002823.1.p1 GENE.GFYU01002823.1~~GFYU01002823.1.p1  ORF type:complete len:276 (+),score=59.36 GFYU01002823.1:94-921(+)
MTQTLFGTVTRLVTLTPTCANVTRAVAGGRVTGTLSITAMRQFSSGASPRHPLGRCVLLGAPGVGKGTYAKYLAPHIGIPHISTGELCRDEVAQGTALGRELQAVVQRGDLVSDELICDILKNRLDSDDCDGGFLLDGFPRKATQVTLLDDITEVDCAFHLYTREDVLIRKLLGRLTCPDCSKSYNTEDIRDGEIDMPAVRAKVDGQCDQCKVPLIVRHDDSEPVVMARLKLYNEETFPVVDVYRERGQLMELYLTGGVDAMLPKILKLFDDAKR